MAAKTTRVRALERLAERYGIDPRSPHHPGQEVGEYLRDPDSICRFFAVREIPADFGPGGEQLAPSYCELLACHEGPWEAVEVEEAFYDRDGGCGIMTGVVDLDRWDILARSTSGWSFCPLPEQADG